MESAERFHALDYEDICLLVVAEECVLQPQPVHGQESSAICRVLDCKADLKGVMGSISSAVAEHPL